jgi:3-oxoacyl-[acyl-carrier protein] reductase
LSTIYYLEPMVSTVVVTGAGSGMGQATATRFLEAGWTVIAIDVSSAPVDRPADLRWHQVDVRDRAAVEGALVDAGTIDAVANVAGVYPPTTLETYTDASFRSIFDINVLGLLNVTAACVPSMDRGGSIVNFASVDAFAVSPGQLLYGASKAAVVMLTKALALELAPKGIRVNGIAPGWVNTPGNAATGRMAAAAAAIPLGRVAEPAEIAEWVWLLTGAGVAGFVDGETIVISGADVLR